MVKYRDKNRIYLADTCERLVSASERNELTFKALARGSYPGKPLAKNELPGVKTVGYWDSLQPQNWGLDWHRNEGIELTFVMNGHLEFLVDGVTYHLKANDLTITRPWQPHKVGDPNVGICKLLWVIIDTGVRRPNQDWLWPQWLLLSGSEIAEFTRYLRENEHPVWETNSGIREIFAAVGRTLDGQADGRGTTYLSILINELIYSLLEMFRTRQVPLKESLTSNRRNVEIFLNDLKKNSDHEWTVEDMAEECEIGKTRFIDYCKRITNMTPSQYLTFVRVEKASELLLGYPEKSILDIALESGFSSSQYFASCFRKQKSMTPSEFRRRHE